MKKIALTSLLAVFAAAGANAANMIDGNPLYMPNKGHFYSETALSSHSEHGEDWTLGEQFGFGVTDRLAVDVKTGLAEYESFDGYGWNDLSFGLTARVFENRGWVADVYGRYELDPVWGDHSSFLDEDDTIYTWTAGIRGGYMTSLWTVAGHFEFAYMGDESFNWDEEGLHMLRVGLDGQYLIDSNWNLTAGIEYAGSTDDSHYNTWTGKFGVNYNIDARKYVGAWISTGLDHTSGDWEWTDGVGYGVKFGIEF